MKIKIHKMLAGYDGSGKELYVFYIKTAEIAEQLLLEMLDAVRGEIECTT